MCVIKPKVLAVHAGFIVSYVSSEEEDTYVSYEEEDT